MLVLLAALVSVASADPLSSSTEDGSELRPPAPGHVPSLPVTGGDDVEDPMDWPDTAGIVLPGNYVGCTGTLIAPDVVITAGHCVTDGDPRAVILGTNDYRDPGERIDVAETYEYPNSQRTYDVAVLVLDEPSSYTPRTIATDCIRDYVVDGADAIVVGYGAIDTRGNQYTPVLQWGVTSIEDADCSDINSGCNPSISPNGEIGAGVDGVDACYGDSGGPLYLPTPKGTYLVGVTSRGYYYADCGDGGVWVRPDDPTLFDWIEETTGRTLTRPACFDPTAPPLYAVKNHPGMSQIDPRYDEGEPFSYEVVTPPTFGGATVNGSGLVTFTPETGFKGEDQVTVRVIADNGGYVDLTIPIKMVSRATYREQTGQPVPGGCDQSGLGGLGGLGALVALAAARRRSAR